jgi:hypothetical protein
MFLLVHEVPGRLRFAASALKRNAAAGAAVCVGLRELPGVTYARANPYTGSVIVHYDGAPATRLDVLSHIGTVPLPAAGSAASIPAAASASGRDLADRIAHAMAERLLERMVRIAVAALI